MGRITELMDKAEEELYAIDQLVDHSAADWIIGFHCQQVAEKVLKAVLVGKGASPPRTHDLVLLLADVREAGITKPTWLWELENLNPFAVQLRYETVSALADFDGSYARDLTHRTHEWAERELGLVREKVEVLDEYEEQDVDEQAASDVPELDPDMPF